ncbi:DNA polymerase I [Hominenteromicrobium sp.]|uniref:DNA polymerase I n=1 Tax=Hominenteromicrobium sp. TaxID=3073581 RepID=UPI003A959FBC
MKLLVLDGNSILNRAFYGIKLLTTKSGEFTNGIVGFLNILEKVKDETEPDAVAIAFDMKAPTFRHKAYAGYKAQRKGMPPELAAQMPVLKELLGDLGYKIVTCEGWEADDILGTFAETCENTDNTCMIATGDRDSLQLVSPKTTVRLATTKFGQSAVTLCDEAYIKETYGVEPKQLIDIKAIQGDTSDNIPGVAGIGEKGAGELIRKFGSLQYIYDNLDELDIKPGMRTKLINSKDNAFLSYDLGTIRRNAPIDTELAHYIPGEGDPAAAAQIMTRLELFKLMERLHLTPGAAPTANSAQAEEAALLPVKNYKDGAAVLGQCEDEGAAYFVPVFENDELKQLVFNGKFDAGKPAIAVVDADDAFLKAFLGSKVTKKYTFALKKLHRTALHLRASLENAVMDTELAAYLLNPSGSDYGVLRLAAECGIAVPAYEDANVQAAAVLPAVCAALQKGIDENGQHELLENIEIPLALVLGEMEESGFLVDREAIKTYGEALSEQVDALQKEIYEDVGYEFNINSPVQLGEALFVKLGLPHGKKTKKGYSTNADVLEGLRGVHPAVDKVLRYRTLTKLRSTYCEGLLKAITADGRIHSSFNQTETRTGRISSTEPNLQNIPVRTPLGREFRRFFIAKEGNVLVDADYSQIELRVLAHVANDTQMQEDFRLGRDIHTMTAARVFDMPEDLVTPQMRSRAKAVNFGIVYGIGAFSLSKDIGVSRREAEDYIHDYLRNYKGVADYMERVVEEAKKNGYVETLFGRRRYLPELASSNFNMRAFGERVARNMPIQGTAADIIKIAMVHVRNRLKAEKLDAKLILQVHDELIVECPEAESDTVKKILEEEMANAVQLSVPMLAEAGSGKSWYQAKG